MIASKVASGIAGYLWAVQRFIGVRCQPHKLCLTKETRRRYVIEGFLGETEHKLYPFASTTDAIGYTAEARIEICRFNAGC
jgi:hypothetical protein